MNRNLWNLYKCSEQGKRAIEVFNPETKDIYTKAEEIFAFVQPIAEIEPRFGGDMLYILDCNCLLDKLIPEEGDISGINFFEQFIDRFQLIDIDEKGLRATATQAQLMKSHDYRAKSAFVHIISTYLYLLSDFYKPILYPSRFDIFMRHCDLLGIELPDIPHTTQYRDYLIFYYKICEKLTQFQAENQLTEAELCACIYDFAFMLNEEQPKSKLPKPTNIWFTGASGGDFRIIDNPDCQETHIWACNEYTRRGDIVVMYCLAPRSYIHSIWRAESNGIFNPFDYYKSRTALSEGVIIPSISIKELKADPYFSQLPIVKKNLQGLNGVQLSSSDYKELMRLITDKGGDPSNAPQLYCSTISSISIKLERDVEDQLLIPVLQELGYTSKDWSRQCTQKAGRGLKAIPDFVFFPKGEKHLQNAPMVIEAKLNVATQTEYIKAFNQAYSYARMMRSSIMGICDKERLILYRADSNGVFNRNCPIFEEHWAALREAETFNQLQRLIAKDIVSGL